MTRRVTLVNTNQVKPAVAPIAFDYLHEPLSRAGFKADLLDLWFSQDFKRDIEEYCGADFGIVCEGEISFPLLLNRLVNKQPYDDIWGLVYKSGGQFKRNPVSFADLGAVGAHRRKNYAQSFVPAWKNMLLPPQTPLTRLKHTQEGSHGIVSVCSE